MLVLNVSYNEKDDAKHLGARWKPTIKNGMQKTRKIIINLFVGKKTFGNMVVIDELYLIEGIKRWFKCGKDTRIIGFGVDKQFRRYL